MFVFVQGLLKENSLVKGDYIATRLTCFNNHLSLQFPAAHSTYTVSNDFGNIKSRHQTQDRNHVAFHFLLLRPTHFAEYCDYWHKLLSPQTDDRTSTYTNANINTGYARHYKPSWSCFHREAREEQRQSVSLQPSRDRSSHARRGAGESGMEANNLLRMQDEGRPGALWVAYPCLQGRGSRSRRRDCGVESCCWDRFGVSYAVVRRMVVKS